MNDIVIKAENIGKMYTIGHQAERGGYTALRDVLIQNARTLWDKTKDLATGKPIIQGDTMEEVWALKDVSFEIRRGEAVGIIGRNGAGKSTLLKILSRITEPTTGRVTIKGRVASLLEVGTGFHPELSGRENIYLNGTILGMTRVEIKQKFDEIVAFAEVEKYLDTPVKRYSSGMYVRLAFAVAAHLEPEILIVDEVLAVGDVQFQKKCLGKMEQVGKAGRTVLFVSHNMGAIRNLCNRGVLLGDGCLLAAADVDAVLSKYMGTGASLSSSKIWNDNEMPGSHGLKIKQIRIFQDDATDKEILSDKEILVELKLNVTKNIEGIDFGLVATNSLGIEVIHAGSCVHNVVKHLTPGNKIVHFTLPSGLLRAGTYSLSIASMVPNLFFFFNMKDVLNFNVKFSNAGWFSHSDSAWKGVVGPEVGVWKLIEVESDKWSI